MGYIRVGVWGYGRKWRASVVDGNSWKHGWEGRDGVIAGGSLRVLFARAAGAYRGSVDLAFGFGFGCVFWCCRRIEGR